MNWRQGRIGPTENWDWGKAFRKLLWTDKDFDSGSEEDEKRGDEMMEGGKGGEKR